MCLDAKKTLWASCVFRVTYESSRDDCQYAVGLEGATGKLSHCQLDVNKLALTLLSYF